MYKKNSIIVVATRVVNTTKKYFHTYPWLIFTVNNTSGVQDSKCTYLYDVKFLKLHVIYKIDTKLPKNVFYRYK